MTTLKENWKKVGEEFGTLGKDLGKTVVKTVKAGAKAVTEWADKDEEKKETPEADVIIDPEDKKE